MVFCLSVCLGFWERGKKDASHIYFKSRQPPNERISQHLCSQCLSLLEIQAITMKGAIDEKSVYPLFRQVVNAKLIQ